MMNEMVTLISNLGLPIVVSIYLLVRTEAKLETLSATITALSEAIRSRLKTSM